MIVIIELRELLEEREISGIDNQFADKSSSRLKHAQVWSTTTALPAHYKTSG